jgi:hypothetical protein
MGAMSFPALVLLFLDSRRLRKRSTPIVNPFERRESQAAVKTFRRRDPRHKSGAAMLSVPVAEHDIAAVRPLFGRGRA